MKELEALFRPIKVGNVQLKNRLVMLAIATVYTTDGRVNDRLRDFVVERAKGGVGLITFGILEPLPVGPHSTHAAIDHDKFVPGLRQAVEAIHVAGAKVAAQIGVTEGYAKSEDAHLEHVSASAVSVRPNLPPPRALTIEEIHMMVDAFGEATRRAREAGFDAVELHAGIGFLINRFLSTCTNQRTDEYGGSMENRMRFLLEILDSARRKAGSDYTLWCRISAEEFMKGGLTLEDTKKMAPIMVKAGAKALDVQVGWHESPVPLVQMYVPRGAYVHVAEAIKRVVSVPVIAAYRINDPLVAARVVAEGKADLVGMARALIADPELPNKANEGRFEDIRRCIACCHCLDQIMEDKPLACAVNARCGREAEYTIGTAARARKVFVIGGGPAGMEAARVAALRGHRVTLWEKGNQLGGQLRLAAVPPGKDEINSLTAYLSGQVSKLGVKVNLGQEATAQAIERGKPDAVIVASGATPIIPDIPGVRGANVVTALEVLGGTRQVGERVVVIGGGMVGCETAELLAQQGKKVTVLEMLGRIGSDIGRTTRWVVLQRLGKAGVRTETKAKVEEITDKGVRAKRDGSSEFFEADSVVLAVGFQASQALAKGLEGKVAELHMIGDCTEPRRIAQAIESGLRVAREL
jgi:2,4-dienoyl-CoA reductase-like NADH-dependent reductase (Old Yellow Enzyme family)/thioredoxin reductase